MLLSDISGLESLIVLVLVLHLSMKWIKTSSQQSHFLDPLKEHSPAQPSIEFKSAIKQAKSVIKGFKEEIGSPGVVVAVSIDGKVVWNEGFGFADVENKVRCSPATVMRIASISKPLTATAAGEIIQIYLPYMQGMLSHGGHSHKQNRTGKK